MPNTSTALSPSVGDYLKALWSIGKDESVSTNDLAERLGISSASVSSMLAKLKGSGLVHYQRYRGARLSAKGRREALRLVRRHRLLETFMITHLDYSWDEVHEEAETLEHALSERFTERLANLLDHPSHDPHGDPIPNTDGSLPDTPNTPLAKLEPGQTLEVARLLSQSSEALTYLAELGINPGTEIEVTVREPVGGLLHVKIDGTENALSRELALLIEGRTIG
ncbi:MAG: metal-dependent transcriptional regulator [Trueperaceae bacterium]|nr:MAG: metal-dependent transcriptional regulator [Trueperaceae bacterium]